METSSTPPHEGPGHEAARFARQAVEEAILLLPEMPIDLDRPSMRDRLLRGVQYLYAAVDAEVLSIAHIEALDQAGRVADECAKILATAAGPTPIAEVERARSHLAAAHAALGRAYALVARHQHDHRGDVIQGRASEIVPAPRPLRASRGTPRLHAIARPPLIPLLDVDPEEPLPEPAKPPPKIELPRAETFEDLKAIAEGLASGELMKGLLEQAERDVEPEEEEDAEPPPLAYEPSIPEVDVLRTLARDCLEDIANHRCLRKPNAIETWLDQAPFEQRLLDNLDTFAALGGSVIGLTMLYLAEARSPDAERAFATALVLGSIDGQDTIAAAVLALKQSEPETYPGWVEGFSLAPSPWIERAMIDLAEGVRPGLAALALDVLLARDAAPDRLVRKLIHANDEAVLARVAEALASRLSRTDAIAALSDLLARPALKAPDRVDDPSLFLAACRSLLRRAHLPVLDAIRSEIEADPASPRGRGAAWLLCLAGQTSDLDRLLTAATRAPSAKLIRGLGRFGHPEALPFLIERLTDEDEEIVAAAAESLDRITGAGLREIIEEPWEIDLPPNIELDADTPIPKRKVERVVADPAAWTAHLAKWKRLDPKTKYRAAEPFVPMQIVHELSAKQTPPDSRAEAAEELAIVTGLAEPFDPHDWVARQHRRLEELRESVPPLAEIPGARLFGLDHGERRGAAKEAETVTIPEQTTSREAPRELPSFMRSPPTSKPVDLTGTSMDLKLPRGPLMPFKPGSSVPIAPPKVPIAPPKVPIAPPNVAVSSAPAPPVKPPSSELGGTSMDVKIPRGPLMPFKPAPRAPAPNPNMPVGASSSKPPAPPTSSAPPSPPELSLAHYAEVWAGIWLTPHREAEIRARFGVQSDLVWGAVRHVWHTRFQADPELEKRFRQIVFHHYALSGKPPPRGPGEPPK